MKRIVQSGRRWLCIALTAIWLPAALLSAQNLQPDSNAPVVLTLDETLRRAMANDPNYASASAEQRSAALDRSIARSALLPAAAYHNQYLYTQPASTGSSSPRFITNNAVHEYASQAQVNETLGLAQIAGYRRAGAAAALSAAQLEVARRGLVAAVVNQYYAVIAADQKLAVADRAAGEAARFATLTGQLEAGREVAHADVVKADLQQQQRERDLADARLAADRAHLELGTLLFPDPRTPYRLADDSAQIAPLPLHGEVEAAAAKNNPELRAALESVRVADAEVTGARAGYLPDLALNYTYGVDAPQLAVNGVNGVRNLGYSASVTFDIPVWDWFATHDRVKQSELKRDAAKVALNFTQRRLLADLEEFYSEARTAADALASLDKSVQTAKESLRLVNLRYRAAEATVLEVVDAQNALISAESAHADGLVRYRVALGNLQTLTGSLP